MNMHLIYPSYYFVWGRLFISDMLI